MMSALLRFVGIRPTVAPTFARESRGDGRANADEAE